MEKKFRKVVVIFIDILGSQSRVNFDEWYNVMSVFSRMVEREKNWIIIIHGLFIKGRHIFFQIMPTLFMTIKMILKIVEKICMN